MKKESGAKKNPPQSAVSATLTPANTFKDWQPYFIIFLLAFSVYANSIGNKYAIDDLVVVTDNAFTKSGVAGIKDIFTHDVFEGTYGIQGARSINGGRYRPLSVASLALEYEIMRKARGDKRTEINKLNLIKGENDPYLSPKLSHGINVLLFALTCVSLLFALMLLFPVRKEDGALKQYFNIPFIATAIFALHPIHTEVVANIKGRDEIMVLLFSLLAFIAAIKYVQTKKIYHLLWGAPVYFLALLSKENAVTFIAIVPLAYFLFSNAKAKDYGLAMGAYLIPTIIFLLLRSKFTMSDIMNESYDIMNNPFVNATGAQRYATIALTFLLYLKLLIFPHPLTHDYYYNQIPITDFTDPLVLLSIAVNLGLLYYAWRSYKTNKLVTFAILFYFITFSPASNVIFNIGAIFNERFVYMASIGFCLVAGWGFVQLKNRLQLSLPIVWAFLLVPSFLFAAKTISRNADWHSNYTLFEKDVVWSNNSAKMQMTWGYELIKKGNDTKDSIEKLRLIDTGIVHLQQAIRIYPTYATAWFYMGNGLFFRNHNLAEAINVYEKAAACTRGDYDIYYNLGRAYSDYNQPDSAYDYLWRAAYLNALAPEPRFMLALICAKRNQTDSAAAWLQRMNDLTPVKSGDYYWIGNAFGTVAKNLPVAIHYLKKAIETDPTIELFYQDLAVAYAFNGNLDSSIAVSQQLIKLNPNSVIGYRNLGGVYRQMGQKDLADQAEVKYQELLKNQGK